MIERIVKKQIDTKHPDYKKFGQIERKNHFENFILGKPELIQYKRLLKQLSATKTKQDKEFYEKEIARILLGLKQKVEIALLVMENYKNLNNAQIFYQDLHDYVYNLIKEVILNYGLGKDGENLLKIARKEINLTEHMVFHNLSDEFIVNFFKEHIKEVERQQSLLDEAVKEAKIKFKKVISEAVTKGDLPKKVLQNLSKINITKANVLDDLKNPKVSYHFNRNIGKTIAHAMPVGIIEFGISSLENLNMEEIESILMHEFFHVISGTSQNLISFSSINEELGYGNLHFKKIGLKFGLKYSWLNEAFTEWLVIKFFPRKEIKQEFYRGSPIYKEERKMLNNFLMRYDLNEPENVDGVWSRKFIEAYFENISEKQSKNIKANNFKELVKEINIFGEKKMGRKNMFNIVNEQFICREFLLNLLDKDFNIFFENFEDSGLLNYIETYKIKIKTRQDNPNLKDGSFYEAVIIPFTSGQLSLKEAREKILRRAGLIKKGIPPHEIKKIEDENSENDLYKLLFELETIKEKTRGFDYELEPHEKNEENKKKVKEILAKMHSDIDKFLLKKNDK